MMSDPRRLQLMLRVWVRDLVLNMIVPSALLPRPLRWRVLRLIGCDVERAAICAQGWIGGRKLAIGAGSFVNYGVRFDNDGGVTLGRNCDIGPGVSFLSTDHTIGSPSRRAGKIEHRPIVVGDGVWIGSRATVLPGVTIGSGAVIAAGSVVTKDCDPDALYAGVPARLIRDLNPEAGS